MGEVDEVALPARLDADVELRILRVWQKRLTKEGVEGTSHAVDLEIAD